MSTGPNAAEQQTEGAVETGPRLRKASAADVDELARSLADAFYDDPVFSWLMPDDETRRARLRRFYAIELRAVGLKHGRAWTEAGLTGAAITTPPSGWSVPPTVMLQQGRLFGAHMLRAAWLLLAVERHHLRAPHYYFAHIGVRPEGQGRGLGSALMRPTLHRCDSEGLPAYLEASSERSAALYERLGFRLQRELSVGGSPPLRLMMRPPER